MIGSINVVGTHRPSGSVTHMKYDPPIACDREENAIGTVEFLADFEIHELVLQGKAATFRELRKCVRDLVQLFSPANGIQWRIVADISIGFFNIALCRRCDFNLVLHICGRDRQELP